MSSDKKIKIDQSLVLKTILNDSQDTIYFKDKNCEYILSSKAHAHYFGVNNPEDMLGKSDFDFFPEEFAAKTKSNELRIMETGIPLIADVECWEEYQDRGFMCFTSSKYPFYNRKGEIVGIWGISKDITPLKRAEAELERVNAQLERANKMLQLLSDIDGLSGLYNHRYFYKTVEKALERQINMKRVNLRKSICLILLDIDRFKYINDTYGHPTGDKAIKHVAEIITTNTRPGDVCFRYGGDEFAILLFDVTNEEAMKLSERIREVVEKSPLTSDNGDVKMTISIGVSMLDKKVDVATFVNGADRNLYKSKQMGRNKITY